MRADGGVDWSALAPPVPGLRCVAVLPARNESALVTRALQALAGQAAAGTGAPYEVIVLANNCSDDTAERVRAFAANCSACAVHVVSVAWPAELANVGRARRALLDEAARRIGQAGTPRGVLASTDADTRVAPDWLAQTLAAIDAGADAVGGRIVTDPEPALPPQAQQLMRLDDSYQRWRMRLEDLADPDRADPWPRHHQHFGASLAVTAEAYLAVGGQPLVPYLEDQALVQALRRHDLAVRHCPAVRVHTSARLDGRAEVGLSWQLRQWAGHAAADGAASRFPLVPEPAAELRLWRLRRLARACWVQARSRADAGLLQQCHCWLADAQVALDGPAALAQQMRQAAHFGRLWDALEPRLSQLQAALLGPDAGRMPMDQAVVQLRRLLAAERRLVADRAQQPVQMVCTEVPCAA